MLCWDEHQLNEQVSWANQQGMSHLRLPVSATVFGGHACFCWRVRGQGPFANRPWWIFLTPAYKVLVWHRTVFF